MFQYNPYIYNPGFDKRCINAAIRHAREDWPNEACGAIIDGHYKRFDNKAPDKSNSFLINDPHFNQAYIDGKVKVVIHSHNDWDKASVEDQEQQKALEVPFGIINLKHKSIQHITFWGDSLPIAPLEGRFFFYGAGFDCIGLVRDYVFKTTGYRPPSPSHEWAFWLKGKSYFEEHIYGNDMPYYFIDLEDVKPGDVLLYNLMGTKYINHCGIFLNTRGEVLHHFHNQLSGRKPMSFERRYLKAAMRHDPNWEGYK